MRNATMKYFKNVELAKIYHVSEKAVRNWIEATAGGKLGLELYEQNGRQVIANTTKNQLIIEGLVEEGRKYRNSRSVKEVTPRPDFYSLFNETQIYDIATNLEIHHEIPREYNYFAGGADRWDRYSQRLATEQTPNTLTSTVRLLRMNRGYLDDLLGKYRLINVVDIGVGNAFPVKELLEHLLEQGTLGRYIALDISPEMLAIAERNVKKWFDGRVKFEGYELDISHERFTNILAQEYVKENADSTANLVLMLGGTLSNLRQPDGTLGVVHDSMGRKDLLVHSIKLDTEGSRRYFDFNSEPGNTSLAPNHRLIFDMLNIDESFYDVEMGFDESMRQRYIRVRLKVSLKITFEFKNGARHLELNKGETILLWRCWQQTAADVAEQFDRNDFYTLHSSQTEDEEYILTVSKVKRQ